MVKRSHLFDEIFNAGVKYDVGSLSLEAAKKIKDICCIGQLPSMDDILSVEFAGNEMSALKCGYKRLFRYYLQEEDMKMRKLFSGDAFEGSIIIAFIVKRQLEDKIFGGINPRAGEFGFSFIRPETWYASYHPFSAMAVTDSVGTGPCNLKEG